MNGFLRASLLTLAAGCVLIAVALGGAFLLVSRPSPLAIEGDPGAANGSPPPTTQPEGPQRPPLQIETLKEDGQTVLRLKLPQDGVNAVITQNLPVLQREVDKRGIPVEVKDVKVAFEPQSLVVVSRIQAFGFEPTVSALATLNVQDGQPRVHVEKAYLGRMPLPGLVKELLTQYLEQATEQLPLEDLPLQLRRVQLERGLLIVDSTPR